MSTSPLSTFSDAVADAVASVAPSVVQVRGRRRPVSGLVYDTDAIITNARALGREDRSAGPDPRRQEHRRRARRMGSCDRPGGPARDGPWPLGRDAIRDDTPRRSGRPRRGSFVEQCRDRQRRHHRRHRRAAAYGPAPIHRAGHPHDGADARRLRRWTAPGRGRPCDWRLDRCLDSRLRGRHPCRDCLDHRRRGIEARTHLRGDSSGLRVRPSNFQRGTVPETHRSKRS